MVGANGCRSGGKNVGQLWHFSVVSMDHYEELEFLVEILCILMLLWVIYLLSH